MATPRVQLFLGPTAGQRASNVLHVFVITRAGIEPSLPALVVRAQPFTTLPVIFFGFIN